MELSHIDPSGNAKMVDVSTKPVVHRVAVAGGHIKLRPETMELLKAGLLKKGDALGCARIAGIAAAKRTPELIPLCHSLPLEHASVELAAKDDGIEITASATCTGKTGVEMEAITAVSIAAVTIYDMCKAVDKEMVIGDIRLLEKRKSA